MMNEPEPKPPIRDCSPDDKTETEAIRHRYLHKPSPTQLVAEGEFPAMDAVVVKLVGRLRRQGISQEELAQRTGIEPSIVREILSGEIRNPTVEILEKLGEALGLRLAISYADAAEEDAKLKARLSEEDWALLARSRERAAQTQVGK